jgi:hypothetical protein
LRHNLVRLLSFLDLTTIAAGFRRRRGGILRVPPNPSKIV